MLCIVGEKVGSFQCRHSLNLPLLFKNWPVKRKENVSTNKILSTVKDCVKDLKFTELSSVFFIG